MTVVPTVDLDRFVHGGGADRKAVATETDRICRDIGFLCILGHGVPDEVTQAVYDISKQFFRGPLESKIKVAQPQPDIIRGYIGFGKAALGVTTGEETPPDLKESFSIGPEVASDAPYYSAPGSRSHFAPNLWPQDIPEFKTAWQAYWTAMTDLSQTMMRLFAHALDLDEHHFSPVIDRQISILGAMYYPDQSEPPQPGQLRAGAHTDFGTMTILKPDNAPGGLQVLTKDGEFAPVIAPSGSFVLNIGDMMARWTNDRWVSTLHRVVNPPLDARMGSERLSLGFFHQPNYDAVVECLPGCHSAEQPAKYTPVAAGEHLHTQFSAQARQPEGAA